MAQQTALWQLIEIYNTAARKPRHHTRKHSEKRQRTERITIRLLPAERAALVATANSAHISIAELIRTSALHSTHHHTTEETHD